VDAIRRLRALEASDGDPTIEDLEALARCGGMGDSAVTDAAFPSASRANKKKVNANLVTRGDELQAAERG
jgi:hypothetical protein